MTIRPAYGLYADLLPPVRPTVLRSLVIRAIETQDSLRAVQGLGSAITDHEYCRRDEACFDARADLRAELMNLGLTKELIDQLGGIL